VKWGRGNRSLLAIPASALGTSLVLLLAVLATVVAAGCDYGEKAAATQPSGPPTPMGTGTVTGTVTFRGAAPPGEQVPLSSDCRHGARTIELRPVIADGDGRLRDVVVSLKGAVGGSKDAPPVGGPVVLDQAGCEYVPRVVALRVGQVLRVKSSDPTSHNVHGLPDRNPPFNFGMTAAGQTKDLTFAVPESFTVKCDVHAWMSASINVFDHPFYAVTDEHGQYEIRNLPPGRHTLLLRHEFLGEQEVEVEIGERGTATADAVFGKRE
jgi:plastocyanin